MVSFRKRGKGSIAQDFGWRRQLEMRFVLCRADKGFIHRGHPLKGLPVLLASFRVCPSFGFDEIEPVSWAFRCQILYPEYLVWDEITGEDFAGSGVFEGDGAAEFGLGAFQNAPTLNEIDVVAPSGFQLDPGGDLGDHALVPERASGFVHPLFRWP